MTSSWIINSFLILGTGILCNGNLERRPAVSSCSINNNDNFVCTNGLCIESYLVCDGHRHCSDGSDETKELCDRYEYETNMKKVNGCVLPTIEGVVYTYEDSNERLSHGTLINLTLTVNENCEDRYHKASPESFRVCQRNGKWKENPKKLCLKMCPPLLSDSLEIKCSYDDMDTNCSNGSIPNTIATLSCKSGYTASHEEEETPLEIHCQSNGHWNKPLYSCRPLNGCVLPTIEGVVYTYEDSNERLSHGTLINLTLTVNENCEDRYHKASPESFRVCQRNGKWKENPKKLCLKMCPPLLSDSLEIKCSNDDMDTNCSNGSIPNTIATLSCKSGYTASHEEEETPLEIHCQSNGHWNKPLYSCRPLNGCVLPTIEGVVYTYEDSNERLSHGTLINHTLTVNENCEDGYHKASPESFRKCLRNGIWKGNSIKPCLKMCPPLLSDSLEIKCSNDDMDTNCSNGSIPNTIATLSCKSGYTASHEKEETPLEIHCQSNGHWNKQLYSCRPLNGCVLPTIEGVVYTYEDSNERLSHGTLINHTLTVNENCEDGYHKASPESFRKCQRNGIWKENSIKPCLKMCPPLLSDSLNFKCSYNGEYNNCSNGSKYDTIATPSCKPAIHSAQYTPQLYPIELRCDSNGKWDKQQYTCEQNCGKVYINSQPMINNAQNASVGTAPWNVGIYRLNKTSSYYELICGGSIIGPNLVVSAAHCFGERSMMSNTILVNNDYKIAVGKYVRDITVPDNKFTNITDVDTVYLNDNYNELSGYYFSDISIVVLKNKISFNDGVAPVCVDWNSQYKVSNGEKGKIVGWGKTEKGIQSPNLLEAFLPFFNNSFCKSMFTTEFASLVKDDKFCAGNESVSGQRVDIGDSGAGLAFKHHDLYYLTGIVSFKDPKTNYSIAVFTEIKYHIEWIRKMFIKHN